MTHEGLEQQLFVDNRTASLNLERVKRYNHAQESWCSVSLQKMHFMVKLYFGHQLGATFVLHHYIQQPTLDHEASQNSSKWEKLLLCMLANSPAKVDPREPTNPFLQKEN